VGVIGGFRWCLLGGSVAFKVPELAYSVATTAFLLWLGVWYFRATERSFADVI
jgi:lipopolysaccharide transport system permease protein